MKYCTFKYRIEYEDGEVSKGWSPYTGEEISDFALSRFVHHCFQQAKPARHITVSDIFRISDAALWLAHIQHTVEFKYLLASRGFAVDIVEQHSIREQKTTED